MKYETISALNAEIARLGGGIEVSIRGDEVIAEDGHTTCVIDAEASLIKLTAVPGRGAPGVYGESWDAILNAMVIISEDGQHG